jgi:hypothetical protein
MSEREKERLAIELVESWREETAILANVVDSPERNYLDIIWERLNVLGLIKNGIGSYLLRSSVYGLCILSIGRREFSFAELDFAILVRDKLKSHQRIDIIQIVA